MRALNNLDIATGTINVTSANGSVYSSVGTDSTWHIKNELPPQPVHFCYILDTSTCTDDQIESVLNGTAIIRDYIVKDENSTQLFPWLFSACEVGTVVEDRGSAPSQVVELCNMHR